MKLRISQILIQPQLVWDDGEELTPGPQVNTISGTLAQVTEFLANLPEQMAAMEQKLTESE